MGYKAGPVIPAGLSPATGQRPGEGDQIMRPKRTKAVAPPAAAPIVISTSDRDALIAAYKAGVIAAWKPDAERGYRLTITGRQDDYVEVAKLTKYLERLGGTA